MGPKDQVKAISGSGGPVGSCGLCREHRVLQNSHLLPAAIYRLVRDPQWRNPNPVTVTSSHAGQTSRQVRGYFLCEDCEERFNRNGERYVVSQCARRDHFPLRELLLRDVRLVAAAPEILIGDVSSALGDHIEEYLYFAASIFWRAAARIWAPDWREFSLGDTYQEQ